MRPLDLASLFACLLVGCGPEVEDEHPTTSPTGYDCSYTYDVEIVVPLTEFSEAAGDDALLNATECRELCQDYSVYSANSCTIEGTAPEGTTTGGGTTGTDDGAGSTMGSGDGTGGGETGTNTEGDDPAPEPTEVTVTCHAEQICGVGGRLHTSLQSDGRVAVGDPIGRWLASMAHAEAASVTSFHAIAAELRAHDAPADLVERALAAADDEVRHAEIMRTLARRRGVEPHRPRFDRVEVRELRAIAIENAAEGCVRELWAALEASHQAQHAPDPELAAAMRTIAADETRHAELALALDAWLQTQLDAADWAEVDAARQAAAQELAARVTAPGDPSLQRMLGLPTPQIAARLHSALTQRVWTN